MPAEDWRRFSDRICKSVMELEPYKQADCLLLYVNFGREVDMAPLFRDAWRKGKSTAVPKVLGDGRMEFYEIRDFRELKPGFQGILEPVEGTTVLTENEASADNAASAENAALTGNTAFPVENVFMVMPGVAFDPYGSRIGYGKGFYDRYLALHPGLLTAAVGFECQIVPQIPAGPYDKKPDWLITEARSIHCGSSFM